MYYSTEEILNFIKEYLQIKTDKELAAYLGINATTLSMWKKRDEFDIKILFKKCDFLSPEFLITRNGEILKSKSLSNSNEKEIKLNDFHKEEILELQRNLLDCQKQIISLERELKEYFKKGGKQINKLDIPNK